MRYLHLLPRKEASLKSQGLIKRMGRERYIYRGYGPRYVATELNTALMEDEERARSILERNSGSRCGPLRILRDLVVLLASGASGNASGEIIVVGGGRMRRRVRLNAKPGCLKPGFPGKESEGRERGRARYRYTRRIKPSGHRSFP